MAKDKWIDISQPLNNKIAHWPGDTPFSYDVVYEKKSTGSVNIGKITTSLHTGTHIDAPFHFSDNGARVIDLDINIYIGRCLVVDVSNYEEISTDILKKADIQNCERLLLRTSAITDPAVFPEQIPVLTLDAVNYLKLQNVKLVGVDLPSVDQLDSKELPIHHSLHNYGIHILENVVLDHVIPGHYELTALPLPLTHADGSPVRAAIKPV
ncbi:arylformamidase [Domibacillus robiginosus]|uniref:arylformamidase n=1 Tax=Domibacillus robiginosus TaxID=1071054 RepID=UPI00067C62F5|nr:arylformamidase [Domibacillus robiginosus]